MLSLVRRYMPNTSGATAIEYALIASLIAIFIVTAVQSVGGKVSNSFVETGNKLK
jgi:pilus assembly protein Flp/PilA